jgi:hypothetical protein
MFKKSNNQSIVLQVVCDSKEFDSIVQDLYTTVGMDWSNVQLSPGQLKQLATTLPRLSRDLDRLNILRVQAIMEAVKEFTMDDMKPMSVRMV